jgi:hypothetical protein
MPLQRRVYRRELREALGYGETWFRVLQKRGLIERGHVDAGGRREWFSEAEARAIVERLARASVPAQPQALQQATGSRALQRQGEAQ